MERVDGGPGLGPDLVLEGHPADDVVISQQPQDGGAPGVPGGREVAEVVRDPKVPLPEQGGSADGVVDPVDGCLDTASGQRPEPRGGRSRPSFPGGADDRARQGVLAVGFDRAGEAEHIGLVDAVAGDRDDGVLPPGQGAGLVEEERVHGAALLQRQPVLHQIVTSSDSSHQKSRSKRSSEVAIDAV